MFLYEVPAGVFYGFPEVDGYGLKVAEHTGRENHVSDPLALERGVDPEEEARVLAFTGEFLPGVGRTRTRHAACMYTLTPDDRFIVDVHPRHPQVCFAAGLCGHGYKMAPALGEALADLAQHGESSLPIGFLSSARFRP